MQAVLNALKPSFSIQHLHAGAVDVSKILFLPNPPILVDDSSSIICSSFF